MICVHSNYKNLSISKKDVSKHGRGLNVNYMQVQFLLADSYEQNKTKSTINRKKN